MLCWVLFHQGEDYLLTALLRWRKGQLLRHRFIKPFPIQAELEMMFQSWVRTHSHRKKAIYSKTQQWALRKSKSIVFNLSVHHGVVKFRSPGRVMMVFFVRDESKIIFFCALPSLNTGKKNLHYKWSLDHMRQLLKWSTTPQANLSVRAVSCTQLHADVFHVCQDGSIENAMQRGWVHQEMNAVYWRHSSSFWTLLFTADFRA